MADSFRLDILMALTSALETITPANGYEFDMTPFDRKGEMIPCVYRGRNVFGEDDPDYCLSILEPPIPLEGLIANDVMNANSSAPWELLVQGFVPDNKQHPTDQAQRFMEDVKIALRRERQRMLPGSQGDSDILGLRAAAEALGVETKGAVTTLDIGQGVCRPPDDSSERAFFWLLLKLQVVEKAL